MDILREATCKEELPREKTAKEKLQETLDSFDDDTMPADFIDILFVHMMRNPKDFHAMELSRIIRRLDHELYCKIGHLMHIIDVAEGRATYLEHYLEGKLYTSEEAARENLPIQISNAKEILDACKERWK